MSTFAVIADHPPNLCPTSNAQTKKIMKEGAGQIPQLAEKLGINIVTLRVFGPDHIILEMYGSCASKHDGAESKMMELHYRRVK